VGAIRVVAELSVNPMVAGVSRPEVVAALQRLLAGCGLHVEPRENDLKVEGDYDRVMAGIREGHGLVHLMGAALTAHIVVGSTAPPVPPAVGPGLPGQAVPADGAQTPAAGEDTRAPATRQFLFLPAQPVRLDALAPFREAPAPAAAHAPVEAPETPEPALAPSPASTIPATPSSAPQPPPVQRRARRRASARGGNEEVSGGKATGVSGDESNSKAGDNPTPPPDGGYDSDA
jgi:uncharacterized protein YqgV (UPF0045/DUF77 family)